MIFRLLLLILLALPAQAAEKRLTAAEIAALLPAVMAVGDGTRQTFSAAGATTFTQGGRASFGSWWSENGQYCSRWPPASGFACYQVYLDDAPDDGGDPVLTWVGESGTPTTNRLKPK